MYDRYLKIKIKEIRWLLHAIDPQADLQVEDGHNMKQSNIFNTTTKIPIYKSKNYTLLQIIHYKIVVKEKTMMLTQE